MNQSHLWVVGSNPTTGSIEKSGISDRYSLEMPFSFVSENKGKIAPMPQKYIIYWNANFKKLIK